MDKFTAIKVFLAVAETGSFSKVSEKLSLSRPMVSRYIALLEHWLNARLLHRTTRHVTLTEAGKQAVMFCQQIANLTQEMENEFATHTGELRGTLRLAASFSFGSTHLAKAINRFLSNHPKLNIQLNLSDKRVNLAEDQIDLAIRICKEPDEQKIARKLSPCHSVLVASREYLAQYGLPNTPEDLASHYCLVHTNMNQTAWTFYVNGEKHDFPINNRFSCDDAITLLNAALAGSGIAMLPRYLTNDYVASGQLQEILPDWQLPEFAIYAVYTAGQNRPLAIRQLLDFLVAEFAENVW